jgi:hypothetical protein
MRRSRSERKRAVGEARWWRKSGSLPSPSLRTQFELFWIMEKQCSRAAVVETEGRGVAWEVWAVPLLMCQSPSTVSYLIDGCRLRPEREREYALRIPSRDSSHGLGALHHKTLNSPSLAVAAIAVERIVQCYSYRTARSVRRIRPRQTDRQAHVSPSTTLCRLSNITPRTRAKTTPMGR